MNCYSVFLSVFVGLFAATASVVGAVDEDEQRFFVERIEPLLKERCFGCHSHASGEMEGGLTLDSRSGWEMGGDRGASIVPGRPDESLLIQAVRGEESDLQMPPDNKLPSAEIDLLVEWVERGAPDPRTNEPAVADSGDPLDWWSLRPLRREALPRLARQSTGHLNPIDLFIRDRLEREAIEPLGRASRRVLIRRVYFDLHGLPPTPEEVEAFVADPDPLAYEKLVDRLLASPRYGERWARHWLDTVHFADSHGCEHDVFRPNAWRYRDYVVDSLNRDTLWPRFVREQLAADRFFPDETDLVPALGFIAAGPLELSRAGTAPVTFDYLDRDDMVTQTMAAFASTTANCARCHDHKFDPVSQEDYYALQSVFAGVGKGDVAYDADPLVAMERQKWLELRDLAESGDVDALLVGQHADVVSRWEEEFADAISNWEPLVPELFQSAEGATLTRLTDHSVLASGDAPEKDIYTITAPLELPKITALRLDVLADDSLPMNGPGRQDNGNLHLNEFEAYVVSEDSAESRRLEIGVASADWNQSGWTIDHALDGNEATAWGIYPLVGQSHYAVFKLAEPQALPAGGRIEVVLKQLHGGRHLIGRVKLYATDAANANAEMVPHQVSAAIKLPREKRTPEQQSAIAAFALRQHAEQQLAALPAHETVYAVSRDHSHGTKLAEPMTSPKVVHVLRRGSIDQPGEVAMPGALEVIDSLPGRFSIEDVSDEAARRAALADWLAANENPLTWRSVVNRVWSYHFGRGICDTPNDLGRMGGTPTHPELLDWLAVWFRDDANGSLKQLHRLILLSEAWQRQLTVPIVAEPHAPQNRDAENRLLWRTNRSRMDAESFRDSVMQISGRINLTMGGPGIQHFTMSPGPQSTPKLDYKAYDWNDPAAARRNIYRVVWRGIQDPFMETMDFPDMALLAPRRTISVSALQALAMYNNDFVLHHSQVLANRLAADHAQLDQQVHRACQLIYLRDATEAELAALAGYAEKHGLAALCRVMFNSNEFLFVE